MSDQPAREKQRIYARIEYEKIGRLRFLGHLDVATVFDRALRRAELPVAYSKGFHPRAKLTFVRPLPVGVAGLHELCGVDLEEHIDSATVGKRLHKQLPRDLNLLSAQVLPRQKRSPFADLNRVDYAIDIDPDEVGANELAKAVRDFWERDSIKIRRETKRRLHTVDIRPGTHKLAVASSQELQLQMSLSLAQDDLVKPAEVLQALGRLIGRTSLPVKLITRVKLYVA